jgi:hypothetical protein
MANRMPDRNSNALFVRLPADLHHWVTQEALRARCSMNAVVVEAIDLSRVTRTEQLADDKHAAAIELAISLARLPKGTAIILKSDYHDRQTDILVRESPQVDYSILAKVDGEEVVFADNIAGAAQSGDGQ